MKLSPYRKADLCSLTAILIALALMVPMPRIIAQAWWSGYYGSPPPVITTADNVILVAGLVLVVLIGFVMPERILQKAYAKRSPEWD